MPRSRSRLRAAGAPSSTPSMPGGTFRPVTLAVHLALAGTAIAAAGWTPPAHAQADAPQARRYAIPAGTLTAVLNRFADEAGVFISAPAGLTQGRTSPGLSGTYTVEQGFAELMRGQPLQAVRQANGTFALRPVAIPIAAAPAGSQSEATLPVVRVTANTEASPGELPKPYAGGQVARGGQLGMLGNTDLMDAPVSITSYTQKAIADQQARSLGDVLALDPSIRTASSGGAYETPYIRGFAVPAIPGDVALNGMFGLVPDRRTAVDFAERVEVIKGPAALLSGMTPGGGVGGVINIVSKRADDVPLTRLSVGALSRSQVMTAADVGRRFGDNNAWGVRVNGAWRDGDTPKDGTSKNLALGSLGLDYRGAQLRASIDVIEHRDREKGNADLGVAFSTGTVLPAPDPRRALVPGGFTDHRDSVVQLRAEYDITPDTTFYGGYGHRRSRFNGPAGVSFGFDPSADGLMITAYQRGGFDVDSAEAGVRTRFSTGSVKHVVAFNVSALEILQYASINFGTPAATNLYRPVPLPIATPPAEAARFDFTQLNSYAVSDTLSWDDRFLLTVGARHQQVRVSPYADDGTRRLAYDRSVVTPMLGAVYKLTPQWSVYANYLEGLSQGPTAPTTVPGLTNPGQVFSPIQTRQREIGTKIDRGSVGGTLALFEVSRPNSGIVGNTFVAVGKQRNRGLEATVFGQPVDGVRVLGGATLMDADVQNPADIEDIGKRPVGAPQRLLNAHVEWDPAFAPGLTLTLRGLYTSDQYLDAANTQRLPSWTRWDAGLRYAMKAAGKPVVLRASVENLADKRYYSSVNTFASVGAPRTVLLSATVDF